MSFKRTAGDGSLVDTPEKGDDVRHPLWPELGTGEVLSCTRTGVTCRSARVHWTTGQVSSHSVNVLRVVAG